MSKDKNPKNFKFNAYWVYGIVIGLFLVFNIFSGGFGASMESPQHHLSFLNLKMEMFKKLKS